MIAPDRVPAFPNESWHEDSKYWGMDLRDYFASAVVGGMFASGLNGTFETRADIAYKMADAMLAERLK